MLKAAVYSLGRWGALVYILTFACPAIAGDSWGLVTRVSVIGDVATFAAGPHSNKPACSTVADDWAFSLTTPGGRGMLAVLLSAQARGKAVSVVGTNMCTVGQIREDVDWILVQD